MEKTKGTGTALDATVVVAENEPDPQLALNVENARAKVAKIELLLEDAKASLVNAEAELKGNE